MLDQLDEMRLPAVVRTSEGLRDALFDELDLLRAGKVSQSHAYSVAKVAMVIIQTVRLETSVGPKRLGTSSDVE